MRSGRYGTRGYAHMVEIAVPVGRVWRALTDPGLIRIWSGQESEVDPRKGGIYRIGNPHTGGREAHIDIFDKNRRLRLIYLNGPYTPTGDSAVVDDFLLDVRQAKGAACLRVLGSGVPDAPEWDEFYMQRRVGWERLLRRMKVTLESPPRPRKSPPASAPAPKPKAPPLPALEY